MNTTQQTERPSHIAPTRVSGFEYDEYDPNEEMMVIELRKPSMGKTPSGFPKFHVELRPLDLMKLIGYDPRTIEVKKRGTKDPANISPAIIELHRSVQRTINQEIVDEMVSYLVEAQESGQFADWSEIDVVTAGKPDLSRYSREHVVSFPQSTDYAITDGQHRYCAILDFVQKYPAWADSFTQAVAISVLPVDRLSEWAGQSFHDKNFLRTAVKVTKALVSDTRGLHNRLAKSLREHEVVQRAGGVNETKDNLPTAAKEFATHAILYKFARAFVEGRKGLDKGRVDKPVLTEENYDEWRANLHRYMDQLGAAFPDWSQPERTEYLFRSSAALQALGVIGNWLYTRGPDRTTQQKMLNNISEKKLDWKRTNKDWGGVIGQLRDDGTVSPVSSRQSVDGTIRFLRDRSGLSAYLGAVD